MKNIVIGIDPGISGAVAILGAGDPVVWEIPTRQDGKRKVVDAVEVAREFMCHEGRPVAYIEAVHAMPKQGTVSMFSFGRAFGTMLGILGALEIGHELVPPQRWKKAMGVPPGKSSSVVVASRLFPSVRLTRAKDHNMADALLIAEYGRRVGRW